MKPIRIFLIIPEEEQFFISKYPSLDIPEVESIEIIDYSSMKNSVIALTKCNLVVNTETLINSFEEKCVNIARILDLPITHIANFSKYVISTNN